MDTTRFSAAGLLLVAPGPAGPRMLLTKRPGWQSFAGTWSIPAGATEPGETHTACAIREASEELGDLPDYRLACSIIDTAPTGWTFHTLTSSPS